MKKKPDIDKGLALIPSYSKTSIAFPSFTDSISLKELIECLLCEEMRVWHIKKLIILTLKAFKP